MKNLHGCYNCRQKIHFSLWSSGSSRNEKLDLALQGGKYYEKKKRSRMLKVLRRGITDLVSACPDGGRLLREGGGIQVSFKDLV